MTAMVADRLFAPLDRDLHLERIGGGNETEVYRTDDGLYVVKVKCEECGGPGQIQAYARELRAAAEAFAEAVGPEHSVPNYYIIGQNSTGQAQLMVLQPYFRQARPLAEVDYAALSPAERRKIGGQLREMIRRSLAFYGRTGAMPDLYGRVSRSHAERKQLNGRWLLPWRLWSFLVKRTLLCSRNLMLTGEPDHRLILIDYDPVRRGKLYRWAYYNARRVLFGRDYLLILIMEKTGWVPGSE